MNQLSQIGDCNWELCKEGLTWSQKQCSVSSSVLHVMITERRHQDLDPGYTDVNQAKREKSPQEVTMRGIIQQPDRRVEEQYS